MYSRKSEFDGHRRLTSVRRSEFPGQGNRQPRDSITADAYRLSIAGGQSTVKRPKTHASTDPRDLSKKQNQKEAIEKLQDFLINQINFREVSIKELSTMSTGMFFDIFSTLVRVIVGPNFLTRLQNGNAKMKPQELIVEAMCTLEYPIKLVKSSFQNLTKQTFPIALGVLDWLVELIKIHEAAENACEDTTGLEEQIPIFEAYAAFAAGQGDDHSRDEIIDQLCEEMARVKQEELDLEEVDIDDAHRRLDEARLEVKDFKRAKKTSENDLIDMTKRIEDSSKYLAMSKYKVEKGTEEVKALREEEKNQKEMIEQLKKDNAEIRERIGDQETAIEKKNRYNALVEEDQKWQESVAAQREDLGKIQVKVQRVRANAGDILIEYNTAANSLREFSEKFKIPSSISANNAAMLEEKQELIIDADQLCHQQISSLTSETDVLNFENDELEKQIQAEQDDQDLVQTQFDSRFQKSKVELKNVEEENALLKNRIQKTRETVIGISADIEALQTDKADFQRKLQDVKEEDSNSIFAKDEDNSLMEFLQAADDKKKLAAAQNKSVRGIFEREMTAVQTRIKRAEEIHELIKKSDLN